MLPCDDRHLWFWSEALINDEEDRLFSHKMQYSYCKKKQRDDKQVKEDEAQPSSSQLKNPLKCQFDQISRILCLCIFRKIM